MVGNRLPGTESEKLKRGAYENDSIGTFDQRVQLPVNLFRKLVRKQWRPEIINQMKIN